MSYTSAEAVKIATAEVGTRETATNNTKYNHWLGSIPGYPSSGFGYPWCASFQSWVGAHAGGKAGTDFPRTASCAASVAWFRSKGRYGSTPHVGAWVHYGPGGGTHVELVVGVSATHITTIGGNTSGSLNGSYFNGDGVYRKSVARNESRIHGYGMPAYKAASKPPVLIPDQIPAKPPAKPPVKGPVFPGRLITQPPLMVGNDVRRWQQRMHDRGWNIVVDGKYGQDSENVCRMFQAAKGLKVDGVVGKDTWAASWA